MAVSRNGIYIRYRGKWQNLYQIFDIDLMSVEENALICLVCSGFRKSSEVASVKLHSYGSCVVPTMFFFSRQKSKATRRRKKLKKRAWSFCIFLQRVTIQERCMEPIWIEGKNFVFSSFICFGLYRLVQFCLVFCVWWENYVDLFVSGKMKIFSLCVHTTIWSFVVLDTPPVEWNMYTYNRIYL